MIVTVKPMNWIEDKHMSKKTKVIIFSAIAVVAVIALMFGIYHFFGPKPADTSALTQAYQKTLNAYFGNDNVVKLQQMLPDSIFTIRCEDQTSSFVLKSKEKQMLNMLRTRNEFSTKTVDLQFYVFDEHFAWSSNGLTSGHIYGMDMDLIDLQLPASALLGMQGVSAETALKGNDQKLENFRQSTDDLWLIGQTSLNTALSDSTMKCHDTKTLRTEIYSLRPEQGRELSSVLFGAPASVLQYLARHTEYLLENDDVYKHKELINTLSQFANFAEAAETANSVEFVINKSSDMLESISFKCDNNNVASIQLMQEAEKKRIAFSANDQATEICFTDNASNIIFNVTNNNQLVWSGSVERLKEVEGYQMSITSVLNKGELQTTNVSLMLTTNINETLEMPNYINIGTMDFETVMHFFEHMSFVISEGFDEIADIYLYNPADNNEPEYIDTPTSNIYNGKIVLVDNEQVTAEIVQMNTETIVPYLVFEITNHTDKVMFFKTHGMQIQNTIVDLNTSINIEPGQTQTWGIQLTKENLGFALAEIDAIYLPQMTIETENSTLFEISQMVELKAVSDSPKIELPETMIYNAARFRVYTDREIVVTEDGIQITVFFVNDSSRNIYIDIDAGIVNDVRGDCVEYFQCYANAIYEKTLVIKGDFTDMAIEDIQKICFELYIRDRDQSQLTGLQIMEISFAENAEG